jgi:two-component system cell cycle sensor histidine kinase PleC
MKRHRISGAGRIALIYFIVSVVYVYLSDFLIKAVVGDPDLLKWLLSNKRLFFLAASSLLIYYLVRKNERSSGSLILELDARVKERTTRLEEAMLLAESTNRTKAEFLANMSHELRTPLNAIIGFSEALLSGVYGPMNEKHREYLRDILLSGENLLGLINDILDLSRIESGSMDLDEREFSLRELIRSACGIFGEKLSSHSMTLECHVEDGLDLVVADQRKLKQVIVNLLSNAIKFSPDEGVISVLARRVHGSRPATGGDKAGHEISSGGHAPEADFVEVSVSDTGIGIAKEDISKLFQPFRQLESPYQKRYGGTGLGLFLTKRLVELHGGRISVDSGESAGTRVTVSIPVRSSA